ncbi:hypothetical protein VP01_203g11 [Puccinia sorghi]|uniref:Uncharacterized protein n=1 Tax=Puccinia sorghi TaxID=27349 RepID=A0A0L6VB15_9BASI|nr:hypothetical protein VP01_203g11 [Puccinia sorghi]
MELLAWCCCIYTMRSVRTYPYLQDVVDGHKLTPGLPSSAEDFLAPFLQHDEMNQEGFIEYKPPQGNPLVTHYQPGLFDSNSQWLGWNVDHEDPNANLENGVMSMAAKRQKTVHDGQFATPALQSNYGFDTSFATGTTNEDTFWPVGIIEPMFQSMPTHEFERPEEDSNVSQLCEEFLSSEFRHLDDLSWFSSLGHVQPASSSPHEEQLVPGVLIPAEPKLQSIASHQLTSPHDDLIYSGKDKQLLSELENFDDVSWPLHHAYGSNDYPQDGAHNQIQSHPPLDNHQDMQASPSSRLVTGGSSPVPPIGKLSVKLDKNSAPVHDNLVWDPKIAELTIPSTSIDEEIMREFMHKFILRTGNLLKSQNLKKVDEGFNAHLRDQLPVKLYRFSKNPVLYQIKVTISPEFAKNPDDFPLNRERKILKQVTNLISWLLYLNSAVFRNLDATETLSNNHKLVDWIFNQIFEPQNSLPVIGRFRKQDIQAFTKGKEFGPIQTMLITLLSSSLGSRREPQTALMILSNYYEYECPEVMFALKNGQIPDLRSLAIESHKPKMIVGSGLDEGSWIQNLGNFPVRSLKLLPESLKPKFVYADPLRGFILPDWGPREPETLDHIRKIASARIPRTQSRSYKFNDSKFPIVITLRKEVDNQGRNLGWVWLAHTGHQIPIEKRTILNRLKKFMRYLNLCHSTLLGHMKKTKFQIDFELQPLLINWIHEVLFDVNQNKLPLVGDFILEDGRSIDSYSPEDFNVIQRLLVCLITSQDSHRRFFQGALSVFGYWLKNMAGMIYSQLFKNDEEYWDIITKMISSLLQG